MCAQSGTSLDVMGKPFVFASITLDSLTGRGNLPGRFVDADVVPRDQLA